MTIAVLALSQSSCRHMWETLMRCSLLTSLHVVRDKTHKEPPQNLLLLIFIYVYVSVLSVPKRVVAACGGQMRAGLIGRCEPPNMGPENPISSPLQE